jgi:hypothetical protein
MFSFGGYVLLVPELLDNYAAAMASAARAQPDGLGYLDEQAAREGWFDFGSLERVESDDERIILQSVVEMFIEKELAISDEGRLVFPSQFNRELPEHPDVEGTAVSYQFEGALLNIYATLTVRLYHSNAFVTESLWKNSALFLPFGRNSQEHRCGFILKEREEGTGLLTVFFGPEVVDDTKILFLKYIHEHLTRKSLKGSLRRERIYRCSVCLNEVRDRRAVQSRIARGLLSVPCLYCSDLTNVPLVDLIEQTFGKTDRFLAQVRAMDEVIDARVDNASKEMMLVGRIMTLMAEAGQIYRSTVMHDWGIDGEIEFKDDSGEASGERIYVQLKSGGSYLRQLKSGERTFRIPKERHITYWQSHRYPVYLVILDKDTKVYWMNISEYLSRRMNSKSRTIPFLGSELTLQSIEVARNVALHRRGGSATPTKSDPELVLHGSIDMKGNDVFIASVGSEKDMVDRIVKAMEYLKLQSHVCDSQIPPGRWFTEIVGKARPRIKAAVIALGTRELVNWRVLQLRSFVSQCIEAKISLITVVSPNVRDIPENMMFLRELNWIEFTDRATSLRALEKLIVAIQNPRSA